MKLKRFAGIQEAAKHEGAPILRLCYWLLPVKLDNSSTLQYEDYNNSIDHPFWVYKVQKQLNTNVQNTWGSIATSLLCPVTPKVVQPKNGPGTTFSQKWSAQTTFSCQICPPPQTRQLLVAKIGPTCQIQSPSSRWWSWFLSCCTWKQKFNNSVT